MMEVKKIPIAAPQLNGNELKYVKECINTNWISSKGRFVEKFEEEFSNYCNVDYGISTSNGTVALHLALETLNIGPEDEVIVPDLTFAATINAVLYTGAKPVIVDISKKSWTIDPDEIENNISSNTKAIIPVHLYGQPCDMDKIMKIAKDYDLYVIEDCAEAHGAEYKGEKVGSFGDIACFSFYGNKILTTGEGGMCLTSNKELKEKMKILRDHGMDKQKKYWHKKVGFNYRMTNLQAAVGVAQLERIDDIIYHRSWLNKVYNNCFKNNSYINLQSKLPNRKKVCWMYSMLINNENSKINRNYIQKKLKKNNIETRPFFHPLHKMEIYKKYGKKRKLENSTIVSSQGINLPTINNMDKIKIEKICRLINEEF